MSADTLHLTPAEAVAKRAIQHVLVRIRDDSAVGWYLGYATESFAQLSDAYAILTGSTQAKVQETFGPTNPKNPACDSEENALKSGQCSADITEMMTDSDVLEYLAEAAIPDRLELLHAIRNRFCSRCGGVLLGFPCGCDIGRGNSRRNLAASGINGHAL